jgi:flavin-binding protein dodecin
MSVAKVIEIFSESPNSFEHAVEAGIRHAHKTLKHIRGAWIDGQKVIVENGRITAYRVRLKLSFVLE